VLYVSGGEKYTSLEIVLNMLAEKKKEKPPGRTLFLALCLVLCEQPNNVRAVAANGGTRS
jgi:hypothetical protein